MLNRLPKMPKPPFILLDADAPLLPRVPMRFVEPLQLAHAGNSMTWIAERLQIPVGTVKSRINRAREKILKLRAQQMVT